MMSTEYEYLQTQRSVFNIKIVDETTAWANRDLVQTNGPRIYVYNF